MGKHSKDHHDKPQRATLNDVAELAGVSKISVSRVMRNAPNISESLREKVMAAANTLSYTPNKLAGALKNQSSNLVAVVLPSMSNDVFPEVLDGIESVLNQRGMNAVLGLSEYDRDRELRVVRDLLSWSPMGVILTGLHHDTTIEGMIAQLDIPVVQLMDVEGIPIGASVGMSHTQAGEAVAEYLYSKGYRRFGYIGAWSERPSRSRVRRLAFERRLAELGGVLECTSISKERSSALVGSAATAELLSSHPEIDCIFYANDDLALGGLFYAMANDINVPHTLGIMGFNGIGTGKATPLPLSTVQTPRHEIGASAAKLLLDKTTQTGQIVDLGFEIFKGETT